MAQDLCALLREKKLISIVRGAPTEKITKIADAIYRGGFRFMEITFDQSGKTPHAVTAEQIRIVREAFDGRLHVGAGTVMTEAQLKLAAEAGAEYIISPNVDTAIIRATKAAGLISIPGAFTPSEIAGAYQAGADFVKLFPVDCVDLKYIKAVRAPINHIPLLAVSGVAFRVGGNCAFAAGVAEKYRFRSQFSLVRRSCAGNCCIAASAKHNAAPFADREGRPASLAL